VYVDAFNLYYGCLKDTPYRWLDLPALCRAALPKDDVQGIRYFTALVVARPHNPDQPTRQRVYLRALATIPSVTIHLGQFLSSEVIMPLVEPRAGGAKFARVHKSEEKGSDVNLATYLLCDACENKFDRAVVVTNDSDLVEPIRLVNERLRKPVGVLCPKRRPSFALRSVAAFMRPIRQGLLGASQFPTTIRDAVGTFHKPLRW
jgi:hypothetical protein